MRYIISLKSNHCVTSDEVEYLESCDMYYDGAMHSIITKDITGCNIERAKGNIRRIPSQKLYNSLNDDFRIYEEKRRIIVKKKK